MSPFVKQKLQISRTAYTMGSKLSATAEISASSHEVCLRRMCRALGTILACSNRQTPAELGERVPVQNDLGRARSQRIKI